MVYDDLILTTTEGVGIAIKVYARDARMFKGYKNVFVFIMGRRSN